MKSVRRRFLRLCLTAILLLVLLITICYVRVSWNARDRLYDSIEALPHHHVALVLGTSRLRDDGTTNWFFEHRMDAAAAIYKAGKADILLVSGDNFKSLKAGSEPEDMMKALLDRGVPLSSIVLDRSGYRTLDSIVRAQKVFGLSDVLIVSQQFHNERALYLADHCGLQAVAYNAADVDGWSGIKIGLRETLARVKMFIDFIVGQEPAFTGDSQPLTLMQ